MTEYKCTHCRKPFADGTAFITKGRISRRMVMCDPCFSVYFTNKAIQQLRKHIEAME